MVSKVFIIIGALFSVNNGKFITGDFLVNDAEYEINGFGFSDTDTIGMIRDIALRQSDFRYKYVNVILQDIITKTVIECTDMRQTIIKCGYDINEPKHKVKVRVAMTEELLVKVIPSKDNAKEEMRQLFMRPMDTFKELKQRMGRMLSKRVYLFELYNIVSFDDNTLIRDVFYVYGGLTLYYFKKDIITGVCDGHDISKTMGSIYLVDPEMTFGDIARKFRSERMESDNELRLIFHNEFLGGSTHTISSYNMDKTLKDYYFNPITHQLIIQSIKNDVPIQSPPIQGNENNSFFTVPIIIQRRTRMEDQEFDVSMKETIMDMQQRFMDNLGEFSLNKEDVSSLKISIVMNNSEIKLFESAGDSIVENNFGCVTLEDLGFDPNKDHLYIDIEVLM